MEFLSREMTVTDFNTEKLPRVAQWFGEGRLLPRSQLGCCCNNEGYRGLKPKEAVIFP